MTQNKRILIIVPAYNEAKSVGSVIEDIKTHMPSADVLVVNDGSLDLTAKRAKEK